MSVSEARDKILVVQDKLIHDQEKLIAAREKLIAARNKIIDEQHKIIVSELKRIARLEENPPSVLSRHTVYSNRAPNEIIEPNKEDDTSVRQEQPCPKLPRSPVKRITKPALRRLARRVGVKRTWGNQRFGAAQHS